LLVGVIEEGGKVASGVVEGSDYERLHHLR
jgi:hypothetical protein